MSLDIALYVDVDTGAPERYRTRIYEANITHNVVPMWHEAGVYDALYESDGMSAADILPALRDGITIMTEHPDTFRVLNPVNGWGSYEAALPWLTVLAGMCTLHPKTRIEVSR